MEEEFPAAVKKRDEKINNDKVFILFTLMGTRY